MTIIYVGLVACLALFLFLFSLPALQRCARWDAKRRQQAQWLRNAQQWATQTAQAEQRRAERQQQWERLQAARQGPVKLSPKTEKVLDTVGLAIGYCVGGVILAAIAIVVGALIGFHTLGIILICIVGLKACASDFEDMVAEGVRKGLDKHTTAN